MINYNTKWSRMTKETQIGRSLGGTGNVTTDLQLRHSSRNRIIADFESWLLPASCMYIHFSFLLSTPASSSDFVVGRFLYITRSVIGLVIALIARWIKIRRTRVRISDRGIRYFSVSFRTNTFLQAINVSYIIYSMFNILPLSSTWTFSFNYLYWLYVNVTNIYEIMGN